LLIDVCSNVRLWPFSEHKLNYDKADIKNRDTNYVARFYLDLFF